MLQCRLMREGWNRLAALGFLMGAAALILRHDLFPGSARYGHWFWIAIVGFVLYCVGKFAHRFSRDKAFRNKKCPFHPSLGGRGLLYLSLLRLQSSMTDARIPTMPMIIATPRMYS